MKRMHINLRVQNLEQSIAFYSALFAAKPTKQKADYAKWMLDDPLVNFSIVAHESAAPGIEHLGIEVESTEELQELYQRVDEAQMRMKDDGETVCCYAKSTKGWVDDPQQVSWELFHTHEDSETFFAEEKEAACCTPQKGQQASKAACC